MSFKGSNSKIDTQLTCPRKALYKYHLYREPVKGGYALRYGSIWHIIQNIYYKSIVEGLDKSDAIEKAISSGNEAWKEYNKSYQIDEDDYRSFTECTSSFLSYLDFYENDEESLEIIASEENLEYGMELSVEESLKFPYLTEVVILEGVIDLVVKMNESVWIIDHKTTGSYMGLIIKSLGRSMQLMTYHYLYQKVKKTEIQGCMLNLHQLSSKRKKDGDWGKVTVDFQRSPQLYTEDDLKNWREHFLYTLNDFYMCEDKKCFPQRLSSCFNFNKPCDYIDLCMMNQSNEEILVNPNFQKTVPRENRKF